MKINRISNESSIPEWVSLQENNPSSNAIKIKCSRENRLASKIVGDEDMVREMDLIEKCAESSEKYYYSEDWSADVNKKLKEYASVCGLPSDRFISAKVVVDEQETTLEKTASVDIKKNIKYDVFDIDNKGNMDHMKKHDWEKVRKSNKFNESKARISGVISPVRGGANSEISNKPSLAKNQNSIFEPDGIGKYANNGEKDVGDLLREEAISKATNKAKRHEEWQNGKIKKLEGSEDLPRGAVFMTASLNANSGIKDDLFGVFSKKTIDSIPTKTSGELLKDVGNDRRASIKRQSVEKHEFTVASEAKLEISEGLSSELKKYLKK